jgi:hypothetical protein
VFSSGCQFLLLSALLLLENQSTTPFSIEKKKNNNFVAKHLLFFFQTETTHNQHDAKIQPYKNFPTTLPAAPIPLLFSQRFPKLIKLVGMILQKVNLFWVNSRAEQINKPIYALLSVPSAWEPSPQET